jgi:DNA-binding beta-propeller fold protein YncE
MRDPKVSLAVVLSLVVAAAGCSDEGGAGEEVTADEVLAALSAGAGGQEGSDYFRRLPHTNKFLFRGELAQELILAAVKGAPSSTRVTNLGRNLRLILAPFALCAEHGGAAACISSLPGASTPTGGSEFALLFGGELSPPRAASLKAQALAQALAQVRGQPLKPKGTSRVGLEWFQCTVHRSSKGASATCGVRRIPLRLVPPTREVTLLKASFSGLEPLGADYLYEGWLIIDGKPVSAGRFDITSNTTAVELELDGDLSQASAYVLTIEPRVGDDPAPSDVHLLAGALSAGKAALTVSHPAAIGVDPRSASGSFILQTPTTAAQGDYRQGIWYLNPAAGSPSLRLPMLPSGWIYEGWVVGAGGPVSTGRFRTATGADSDGAGPTAGPSPAPAFPGQDFITPPVDLVGQLAVITVEPVPDNSSAPFFLKPLAATIIDAGAGTLQALGRSTAALPAGKVRLKLVSKSSYEDTVAVANRAAGSLSVINAQTGRLARTIDLPGSAEPMYVAHARDVHRVFVGDRAADRVLVLDDVTYRVLASVPTDRGVFHMWAGAGDQLWVVCDVDKTLTIIDTRTLEVRASLQVPRDLVQAGGKPHDVILDARGRAAFVTLLGLSGPNDYVVKYDTRTLKETARAAVGGDPHLGYLSKTNRLFVPAQQGDAVHVLDAGTLGLIRLLKVPGAHGSFLSPDGRTYYTTNISGGGPGGLVSIDTGSLEPRAFNTPFATPHNVAVNARGNRIFVTHSGAKADKVTFYRRTGQALSLEAEITTGLNPFGLFPVNPRKR